MVPYCANSSRSSSSVTSSFRFLTYRFMPWYLAMRSWRTSSILALRAASRSAFFCARLQNSVLPLCSLPLSASTHLAALSGSSKLTNPKPLEPFSGSSMILMLVVLPNSLTISSRSACVTSGPRFLMYTLEKTSLVDGRSVRFWNTPTYTIFSSIIMPLTFSIASAAASSVSKCTKPKPRDTPDASVATLHDRIFPNAEKVSCRALLSIDLSRFLMYTLPAPDLRVEGSRCDHMMRMGLPLSGLKLSDSSARSAAPGSIDPL
mmetsp:Transcript_76627/g.155609  ORF Transcript_76627/g.155609 Transcript_76627/m.155609 type:complete len:262 (-) Transcript_76627:358-1143(-)